MYHNFFSFVLVARDPTNTKGAVLNRLVAENDEEKILFERGQKNTIARKECAKDSLFRNPPTENEKMLIHDFFIKTVDHAALRSQSFTSLMADIC